MSNENHGIVGARPKFVHVLVKVARYGEAIGEIAEIKQIEPAIPYVQAYEERLQTIGSPFRLSRNVNPPTRLNSQRQIRTLPLLQESHTKFLHRNWQRM
jgi:hypothetical protein